VTLPWRRTIHIEKENEDGLEKGRHCAHDKDTRRSSSRKAPYKHSKVEMTIGIPTLELLQGLFETADVFVMRIVSLASERPSHLTFPLPFQ
jgi:hypothetical protein